MKTFKASVDTEIITSEDGLNTYEVIKKLSLPEGKCAYLISLYPTRNESNIYSNDSTLNHLVSHMTDIGLKELHILSLFSKVVTSKISSRVLKVDEDNMKYIDKVMHSKKFKNSQFIISLSINQQNNAVYEKYCYMQYKKAELFLSYSSVFCQIIWKFILLYAIIKILIKLYWRGFFEFFGDVPDVFF